MIDSLIVKGLLLRVKAQATRDEKARKACLSEASALTENAKGLRASGKGELSGAERLALGPAPTAPPTADGGVSGGVAGGVAGGVVGGTVGAPPPPPSPLVAVRVGGQIKEPRKTRHAEVVYPEIAKSARVQGIVIMECTISPEGKVIDVKVLHGNPLLDGAAIEAVKQWEYTPTLLNGVPVSVIMTVTTDFKLS